MMENQPPLTSPDGSSNGNPPERCPHPLYSTQEDHTIPHHQKGSQSVPTVDVKEEIKEEDDEDGVMEEFLKGHKDLYQDTMVESSSYRNPPERCPRPLYSQDSTQEGHTIPHHHQVEMYVMGDQQCMKEGEVMDTNKREESYPDISSTLEPEEFIHSVRIHPELWDLNNAYYSNRNKKHKAWEAIAAHHNSHWSILRQQQKASKIKAMKTRWKAMRDNFRREYKKQKLRKSGSGGKTSRTYCYYKELMFLKPLMGLKEPQSNMDSESDNELNEMQVPEEPQDVEEPQPLFEGDEDDTPEMSLTTPEPESTTQCKKSKKRNVREQAQEFVDVFKKIIDTRQRDPFESEAFAKSLIPQMDRVDPSLVCEMRMEIMRVIMSFQKRSVAPSIRPQVLTVYDVPNSSQYTPRFNDPYRSVSQGPSMMDSPGTRAFGGD